MVQIKISLKINYSTGNNFINEYHSWLFWKSLTSIFRTRIQWIREFQHSGSGSILKYGSGSLLFVMDSNRFQKSSVADPWHFGVDPDPGSMPLTNGSGSCYFRHWPWRCQQNFSGYYFLKVHLHHFSKIKSQKESQNSRYQGFSYYLWSLIEGSGAGSGSIPLTSGSGSGFGRPKNMWIRIRNTEKKGQDLIKILCFITSSI